MKKSWFHAVVLSASMITPSLGGGPPTERYQQELRTTIQNRKLRKTIRANAKRIKELRADIKKMKDETDAVNFLNYVLIEQMAAKGVQP